MKTKELIRLLQEEDPSGELECCINNADIHCVYAEEAYWDGCLQVLKRNPDTEYYNIIGAKYIGTGAKLNISPLAISDAIFNNEDLPVEYEGLSESKKQFYEERVAHHRKFAHDIKENCERGSFVEYMKQRLLGESNDFEENEVVEAATTFYNEKMSYQDSMPEDILKKRETKVYSGVPYEVTPSWNERRRKQWDREIAVDLEEGKLKLKKIL